MLGQQRSSSNLRDLRSLNREHAPLIEPITTVFGRHNSMADLQASRTKAFKIISTSKDDEYQMLNPALHRLLNRNKKKSLQPSPEKTERFKALKHLTLNFEKILQNKVSIKEIEAAVNQTIQPPSQARRTQDGHRGSKKMIRHIKIKQKQ